MPKTKGARLSLTLPGPLPPEDRQGPLTSPPDASGPSIARLGGAMDLSSGAGSNENLSTTPPQQRESSDLSGQRSPGITSLPPVPLSPKPERESPRALFSNRKAAKSSAKIPGSVSSVKSPVESINTEKARKMSVGQQETAPGMGSPTEGSIAASEDTYVNQPSEIGTLSRTTSANHIPGSRDTDMASGPLRLTPTPTYSSRSLPKNPPGTPKTPGAKKSGSMFNFMKKQAVQHQEEEHNHTRGYVAPERRGTPSRDRHPGPETLTMNPLAANDPKHILSSSKSGFLKVLKTGTNKAVSGYKKGRERLLKGSSKPTSSSPAPNGGRQSVDPDYEMQILSRPLLDQVRLTRIAARLEQSRDKTEFWLPSLPWRCIDYLNFKGVEEEGIYRHSGSQIQINYYKQKFDRERDVNLYEETDLYDVNTISSLLKAWFRELPDELFPSQVQASLVSAHMDSPVAPQALKEAISQLEPWRYYLLFAITCHLSLISNSCDKNKMTIENLHTCIGRSLRIERVVFFWLVGDWRNCWEGCSREREFLMAEYAWLEDENAQLEGDHFNPPPRQDEFGNIALPAALQQWRAPSPVSQAAYRAGSSDSRLGSSSSRQNMEQDISYTTNVSHSNLPTQVSASGSRKTSQSDFNSARSFSDRMQQAVASATSAALGSAASQERGAAAPRRPGRTEVQEEKSQWSHRRAQSQPRGDNGQQRGKSPASVSGRRRPRGETTTGHAESPSNHSPSRGFDPSADGSSTTSKPTGGRRRKETNDTPDVPSMPRERLESLQQRDDGSSRRERDVAPQLEALSLGGERVGRGSARNSRDLGAGGTGNAKLKLDTDVRHERKDSKFRLSEPKFPEPISPTFRGS